MATEEGTVIRVHASAAWVKTIKTSACESCEAKSSCHTLGGGNEMEIEAVNEIGAKIGDHVVIGFETASLLKVSFLVYMLPIFFMILGAVIGKELAHAYNYDESSISAIFACFFFAVAFLLIRFTGKRISTRDEYKARIIRIKRRVKA